MRKRWNVMNFFFKKEKWENKRRVSLWNFSYGRERKSDILVVLLKFEDQDIILITINVYN